MGNGVRNDSPSGNDCAVFFSLAISFVASVSLFYIIGVLLLLTTHYRQDIKKPFQERQNIELTIF